MWELMLEPGIWNEQFVRDNFLAHEAEAILSLPLSARLGPDIAVWHFRKDGKSTVKSGCWLASDWQNVIEGSVGSNGSLNRTEATVWDIIWKLKVANKVKVFLWRACHDFLPCAANLSRRHIGTNAVCFRCDKEDESTIHCLWNCDFAKKVWKFSFLKGVYKSWKGPNFITLLNMWLELQVMMNYCSLVRLLGCCGRIGMLEGMVNLLRKVPG